MSLSSYFRPAFVNAFCVVCTSDVTTRRNEISCFDSLAIARMFTAPFERASVTRASSPGLSATNTLNSFVALPPLPRPSESAGPLQKASSPLRERQGTRRARSPGNKIAPRMFGGARSFLTNPSSPQPHPPRGGQPERDALQQNSKFSRVRALFFI